MMPRIGLGTAGAFGRRLRCRPHAGRPRARPAVCVYSAPQKKSVVGKFKTREHDLILDGRCLEPLQYGIGILGTCVKQIADQKRRCEGGR
jgi:hypothetical protein